MKPKHAAKRPGGPIGAAAVVRPAAATHVLPPLWKEFGAVFLACTLTVAALSLLFPPIEWWPLAFVCLVPWAVVTCRVVRTWVLYWISFLLGGAFFLFNLKWLMPVTGLGYAALAFYLAVYWPLAVWAIRTGRRRGISPIWTLPVVWVACELLRAWVMTGFPWLLLGHAFYRVLPLIQICDLVGAYGVTFVAALVNGVLVELVQWRWPSGHDTRRPRQLVAGAVATIVVLSATLAYGFYRVHQTHFEEGPRVAVVQHDFPLVSAPPWGDPPPMVLASYLALAAEAARERPDLLVFPETVWGATQNREFLAVEHRAVDGMSATAWSFGKLCDTALAAFARGDYAGVNAVIDEFERRWLPDRLGQRGRKLPRLPETGGPPVTVIVGSTSIEVFPETAYPRMKRYNSALMYDADGQQRRERYDKNHLVPFGEYVPFRYGRFHWLYRRLNELSPFSENGKVEYSLSAGAELTVFELGVAGRTFTFATPICYEDVMPYVIRKFVWNGRQRRTDFLVNISNDGWFLHSAELPQHLAICVFRAVENRVGIARAVNTGISGFIDPNGRIYSLVDAPGRTYGPGVVGCRVEPVYLDQRTSFYGRTGDWFAGACLVLSVALWLEAVFVRWVQAVQRRVRTWLIRRDTA